MDNVTEITQCRACHSPDLELALDFGSTPLANRYLKQEQLGEPEFEAPLQVMLCHGCGCVQLKHTVSPELLFNDYLYASSTSGTLKEHFGKYHATVVSKLHLKPESDLVVGIGGNDGVLERWFQTDGFRVLNVEPAKNISQLSQKNGVPTLNLWFNRETVNEIVSRHGQASLITCNNCFAHMPDIHDVVNGVKTLLKYGGYFVFENAYLLDTVCKNLFDQFYHEHVFYWGLRPLKNLFESHGMTLVDVEFNDMQDGSFRAYVCKDQDDSSEVIRNAIALENENFLYDLGLYKAMESDVSQWTNYHQGMLAGLEKMGHSVCCYGVPAKFTLLSKLLGLTAQKIKYAVEDSPLKVGLYTPVIHIPIVGPDHFHKHSSDACLITARNYAEHIKRNNPQYTGTWIDL